MSRIVHKIVCHVSREFDMKRLLSGIMGKHSMPAMILELAVC